APSTARRPSRAPAGGGGPPPAGGRPAAGPVPGARYRRPPPRPRHDGAPAWRRTAPRRRVSCRTGGMTQRRGTRTDTMADGSRPGPALAALSALTGRRWKLGPAKNKVSVERGVAVRMRDGAVLVADHYAPVTSGPRPTVLMRCPYGRSLVWAMSALLYAERGYHVLLQSCRGTFGSGGTFRPCAGEAADGHDPVGWLRGQGWFDGRLATVGASYLAYVQWALALDPPPELKAMVVQVGPHDLGAACF